MKLRSYLIPLCVAALAMTCVPALAQYVTECENISPPADGWSVCLSATAAPGTPSNVMKFNVSDPYAYGGSGLKVIDGLTGTDGNLFLRGISSVPFSKQATVVVRLKTTGDEAFTASPWSRTLILSFLSESTTKRAIGLSVRPTATAVINSNGDTFYPGSFQYACDNTRFVTYTICGSVDDGVGSAKRASAEVYRNGNLIISTGATINSSPETQIHNGSPDNKGYDMVVLGSAPSACAGSYIFDRVAWKAGLDPAWQPWGTPTGSISGVISKVGDPSVKVDQATVTLSSGQSMVTGPDGAYSFTGLDPESYTIGVSAPGYLAKTVSASTTLAVPAAVRDISMPVLPAAGPAVYDDFEMEDPPAEGEVGRTDDSQRLPWLKQSDQAGNGTDYYCGYGTLTMNPCTTLTLPHGFSIGGGLLPANVDVTVDMSIMSAANWGGGIMYRQTQPCIYDNYPLVPEGATEYTVVAPYDQSSTVYPKQAPEAAGYLVFFDTGKQTANLWRNGLLKQAATSIDWNQPHQVRIVAFGDYHELRVDGAIILTALDSGKLTGGYVGLTRYEAQTMVDRISVQPLGAGSSLCTISGSVYDAASPSTKLAGALITLSDGRTVTTDANGAYSFGLSSLSETTVTAKVTAYVSKSVVLEPVIGTNTVNFALDADAAYHATIAGAKAAAVGSAVQVAGKVITAQWGGTTFYIEEADRSAGIRVVRAFPDALLYTKISCRVDVGGALRADAETGELYIDASSVYEPSVAKVFLKPVTMNGRTVLDKAAGTDVTGLDVKVVGKVTAVNSPADFTIDDGSGAVKVLVGTALNVPVPFVFPQVNDYVSVEGAVSLTGATPESAVRCIRPWNTNGNFLKARVVSSQPVWIAGFEKNGGSFTDNFWAGVDWWPGNTNATFTFLGYDATGVTRPTSMSGAVYCEMKSSTPWSGNSGASIIATWPASDDPFKTPTMDCEYEASCWARGVGNGSAGVNKLTTYSLYTPGDEVVFPAGDFDWQKFSITWRYGMSNWRGWNDFIVITTQCWDTCTAIQVDDYFLGYARGTVKQIDPVRY